jgi:hypothetical protein
MAPATAATPDPADPPVNTITREQWSVLLQKGILSGPETVCADLEAVNERLAQDRSRERRREQRGSN